MSKHDKKKNFWLVVDLPASGKDFIQDHLLLFYNRGNARSSVRDIKALKPGAFGTKPIYKQTKAVLASGGSVCISVTTASNRLPVNIRSQPHTPAINLSFP